MQWELSSCWKTWVWEKMMPKHKLPKSIFLHAQRLNYGVGVCELEDHVGEKWLSSNWLTKFGLSNKTPLASFPNRLLESTWVEFMFPYALLLHHERVKRNITRVVAKTSAKLPHYTGIVLVYPMENEMPFVHHVVERWGCGNTIENNKGLNERTWWHLMLKPMSKLMWAGWE